MNEVPTTTRAKRATGAPVAAGRQAARERIVSTAYDLFCRHGIRAVGIDTIIEQSGVAKMTMYRHFASKDELVLEVMRRREQVWAGDWLVGEVERRAVSPVDRLLAIFDVFDAWFHRRTFEGCLFVNVLLEIDDRRSPLHRASREHLANIRSYIRSLAEQAGIADADVLSRQWHILMKGSIVQASEGHTDAAQHAKSVARLILAERGFVTD